jgi:sec-independent protein translocase protein TatA
MIPGLPQVGGVEMLILLAIILLFFGAKRIPQLGRSLGNGLQEFRKDTTEAGEDAAELQACKRAEEEEPSPNEASRSEETARAAQRS